MIPGAVLDPGVHWNGEAGWLSYIQAIIWHYTVGLDSRAIGRAGFFPILISQDGTITCFAPWNSVNWHACEWNWTTIGIEIESLDGSITDAQIISLGYVTLYLLSQTGLAATFWDGGRIDVGGAIPASVTNHRDLHEQQCDEHFDGYSTDVWNAAMAGGGSGPAPTPTPPPPIQENNMDRYPSATVKGHTLFVVRGNDQASMFWAHQFPDGHWENPLLPDGSGLHQWFADFGGGSQWSSSSPIELQSVERPGVASRSRVLVKHTDAMTQVPVVGIWVPTKGWQGADRLNGHVPAPTP